MRRFLLAAACLTALACSNGSGDGDAAGSEAGADSGTATGSGLVITHLAEGSGDSPGAASVVEVHYHGTLEDGSVFDSSVDRGRPARFPLNRVIPCWTEGVQQMKVGGKARLLCPPEIAYGARGTPGGPIPPNATLTFEVELLEIVR